MDGLVLRVKHVLIFVLYVVLLSAASGYEPTPVLFSFFFCFDNTDSVLESWTWIRHPVLITTPYRGIEKKRRDGNTSMAGNLDTSHSVVIK